MVLARKAQYASQKDWKSWTDLNTRLIGMYSDEKQFAQSVQIGQETLAQLSENPQDDSLIALTHLLMGENYYFMKQREASIEHFLAAYAYYQTTQKIELIVRSTLGLGNNYLILKKFDLADTTLRRALDYAKQDTTIAPVYFAQIYNNLLVLYFTLGDYSKALTFAPAALEYSLNREGVAPEQMIKDLTNAGVLYRILGDYDRAELYLRQALERDKSIGDPDYLSYNNLGALHVGRGEYRAAVPLLEQAVEIVRSQPKESIYSNYFSPYQNLADAYVHLEEWEKIKSLLDEILLLHQSNEQNIETTWLNLAKFYVARNQPSQANVYVQKSLDKLENRPQPDRSILSELYRLQAKLDLELRPDLSLEYCRKGIQILSLDSLPPGKIPVKTSLDQKQLMDILHIQGKAYERLSLNREDSIAHLVSSLHTWVALDSLMDQFLRFYPMEGAQYQLLRNAKPAYQSAIRIAYRLYKADVEPDKHAELGYYFSEKSKSVLLQARMREHTALQLGNIPLELQEKDKQLRDQMSFYRDQLFQERQKANPDSTKIQLWNKYLFDYQLEKDELIAQLQTDFPNYYRSRFQTTPVSIEELLASLKDEQAGIVMYSVGEQYLFSWLLKKEQNQSHFHFHRIPLHDQWKDGLTAFINKTRDYDRVVEYSKTQEFWSDYVRNAYHWYTQLLEPVLAHESPASAADLVIVPDGMLGYLPFELLLTELPASTQKIGEYSELAFVVRTWNVRYEYAASLLIQSTPFQNQSRELFAIAPEYTQTNDLLTMANGVRGESDRPYDMQWWPPLSFNQEEVRTISKIAKGSSLIGASAQEKSFRERASTYQVLHLAMHAFANDEAPLYSGLVFSQSDSSRRSSDKDPGNDGILYAHELYNLSLQAELAVLSACNTGIGKLAKGEGILSLARAFKYAGVPNTVMSLWQAEDQATASIMASFYQLLQKGVPKHEALRKAKLIYMDSSKSSHPFYWATFVLYGDDQAVTIRQSFEYQTWAIMLFAILIVLGIAGYFAKRNYI